MRGDFDNETYDPQGRSKARGFLPVVVLAVCALVLAGVMAFGGGSLWDADQQEDAKSDTVGALSGDSSKYGTISSYTAQSSSKDDNRASNLALCASTLDGVVIKPGETFSFNEIVGETTPEKGYKRAVAIMDGEETKEYGGGICQVSTAIYVAAVEGNLGIVQRFSHSTPPDYVPVGLDATVSYGSLDLKIANNTDAEIKLRVKAEAQSVTAWFEGKMLKEGLSIKAVSAVTSDYLEADESGQEQRHYKTESYRVICENGQEIAREPLAVDYYLITEKNIVSFGEGSVAPTK